MTAIETYRSGRSGPGLLIRFAVWWGPRPLLQAAVIALLLVLLTVLIATVFANMLRVGISPGFEFLTRSANFEIGEQLIAFNAGDTYLRALAVGLLNTIKVALLGCILATVLGVSVGVAGLSNNPLLAGLVRGYIEVIRNTPLLLQLFLWISLAQALPPPRRAFSLFGTAFLSNRGIFIPGIVVEGASASVWLFAIAVVVFVVAALVYQRRRISFGQGAVLAIATTASLAIVLVFAGLSARIDLPALSGFNIRGGYSLTPEFAALLIGLVVKFSASIAEIVRAGILSVKAGQWEAGRALGLNNRQIMRLIVLPQALRVITPLTTSNYLDLTKDSSLAVAIGYPDLVNIVNTTANTTGQAFEALSILVIVYLVINIGVSLFMNEYNKRVALRGGKPA